MTSRDFCYWLQGYFEIQGETPAAIEPAKVEIIQRHLSMVFAHEIDPSFGKDNAKLNHLHRPQPTQGEPMIRC